MNFEQQNNQTFILNSNRDINIPTSICLLYHDRHDNGQNIYRIYAHRSEEYLQKSDLNLK